jgi:YaiO family outer membrane protein
LNIARYFGDFRVAYAVDFARLRGDSTTAAHSAAVTYYASARTQLTANIAVGEEAEAVAPGLVLRTDVRAVSVGGRHALDARWGASWWFGSHRQGDLYRRRYVGVSVSRGL